MKAQLIKSVSPLYIVLMGMISKRMCYLKSGSPGCVIFGLKLCQKLDKLLLSFSNTCSEDSCIENFYSKCEQMRSCRGTCSHLLNKSSMKNFIFCEVSVLDLFQSIEIFASFNESQRVLL